MSFTGRKVLIFDFDGTLADTLPLVVEILGSKRDQYQLPELSKTLIDQFRDKGAREAFLSLHLSMWQVLRLVKTVHEEMRKQLERVKLFPDIAQVLSQLKKRGYRIAIISSNDRRNIEKIIEREKLSIDYLHCSSNLFGKDKTVKRFLQQNKLTTEEVVYIGDEVRDVEAMKKVRIPIVSVTWGFNSAHALQQVQPTAMISAPQQLLELLR